MNLKIKNLLLNAAHNLLATKELNLERLEMRFSHNFRGKLDEDDGSGFTPNDLMNFVKEDIENLERGIEWLKSS